MKNLMLAILVLCSLPLGAQTHGTGPDLDDFVYEPDRETNQMFAKIDDKLHEREIICGLKKKGQPKNNIMDTYHLLSLTKVTNKCKMTSRIYKCVYDWDVQNLIKDMSENPRSVEYLMRKFEIERKSAEEVINFYKNLNKYKPD